MIKSVSTLSRGLLLLGVLLILAGIGWGIWTWLNAPPAPEITETGAVVLAETVPPQPTVAATATPAASPSPTPPPTRPPEDSGPTPELLPEYTVPPAGPTATARPTSAPPTPVPTATPWPRAVEPPTRIVAPSIGLDVKIVPMGWSLVDHNGILVSEWVIPKNAAGWHMNSGLPGHGENVVISGHHNIEGKVFRYLVDLHLGDQVILYVNDTPYYYKVTDKYILKEAGMPLRVRRKNAQWIMPSGDERLTLVTCWPYQWPGNSHRVIVVARPPDYLPERGVE